MSMSGCSPTARPATSPRPGTTLKTPSGHARLGRQLGDAQGTQRREFGRLDHQRIAGRQRRARSSRPASRPGSSTAGRRRPRRPARGRSGPRWSGPVGETLPKTLSIASAYQRIVFSTSGRSNVRQSRDGLARHRSTRSRRARPGEIRSGRPAAAGLLCGSAGALRLQAPLLECGARGGDRPVHVGVAAGGHRGDHLARGRGTGSRTSRRRQRWQSHHR